MSILAGAGARVVVQGLTGREGTFHARSMIEYGTDVRAGVTPGKGGTRHLGLPVFDTVAEAVRNEGVDASVIFVPALAAAGAVMEAAAAGVGLIVCITEGIPVLDMVKVRTSSAALRPGSSARTRPASSRPARPSSASCPALSTSPGPSASSRARER